jgi:hypothetical protein
MLGARCLQSFRATTRVRGHSNTTKSDAQTPPVSQGASNEASSPGKTHFGFREVNDSEKSGLGKLKRL